MVPLHQNNRSCSATFFFGAIILGISWNLWDFGLMSFQKCWESSIAGHPTMFLGFLRFSNNFGRSSFSRSLGTGAKKDQIERKRFTLPELLLTTRKVLRVTLPPLAFFIGNYWLCFLAAKLSKKFEDISCMLNMRKAFGSRFIFLRLIDGSVKISNISHLIFMENVNDDDFSFFEQLNCWLKNPFRRKN